MNIVETGLPLLFVTAFAGLLCAEIHAGVAGVNGGTIRRAVCVEGYWIAVATQAITGALITLLALRL